MEYRSFSAIVRIYLTLLVTWTTFISTASRVHTRQPLLLCFYLRLLKGFATFAFDLLPGMHLETACIYIYIYKYIFFSLTECELSTRFLSLIMRRRPKLSVCPLFVFINTATVHVCVFILF
jgi:hypothetical protein